MPHLKSPHSGGSHALFADVKTRFLKPTTRPEILLAILTINGGEVLGGG
jgi:prepilin-type processing-associated H-X9-DG protein